MKTIATSLCSAALSIALAASATVASAQTYDGSPYTAWANDYSGSEPHTLVLWKFNTAAPKADSSENGRDVLINNSTGSSGFSNASVGVPGGRFGEGMFISTRSTTDASSLDVSSSVSLFPSSALSLEFWFKPIEDGVAGGSLSYFVDKKYDSNTGVQLVLNNQGTGNGGSLQFIVANGAQSSAVFSVRTSGLEWKTGEWYHVAATFEVNSEGDTLLKIFRNGEMLASDSRAGFGPIVNKANSRWRLGNRLGSGYGAALGYYDNFRISDVAYQYAAIPEPSVAAIAALGGLGLLLASRRRRSATLRS
ncbi:MAG TPA: LamG-like jellyroll fold domain-containing protein [Chthoniobacteraceae bacterium]|nr:LamG-like jellyroll fold domain-containing protein [Chthoniobacteraceae bacterium]